MERDNFDEAIDEIVAFTGGDMRLALRPSNRKRSVRGGVAADARSVGHANKQFPSIFQAAGRPRLNVK